MPASRSSRTRSNVSVWCGPIWKRSGWTKPSSPRCASKIRPGSSAWHPSPEEEYVISFRRGSLIVAVCILILDCRLAVPAAETPFIIPSIASLTGYGSFLGKAQEDTLRRFETAVNRQGGINGRPIHFEIYDDQSNPQVAVQAINAIITTKASVVVGPSLTNQCLAVLPLVQGKLVQYCISPGVRAPKDSLRSLRASGPKTPSTPSRAFFTHAGGTESRR